MTLNLILLLPLALAQSPVLDAIMSGKTFRIQHPTQPLYWACGTSSNTVQDVAASKIVLSSTASDYVAKASAYSPNDRWLNFNALNTNQYVRQDVTTLWQSQIGAGSMLDYAFKFEHVDLNSYYVVSALGNMVVGYDASANSLVIVSRNDPNAVRWAVFARTQALDAINGGSPFSIQHPAFGWSWSFKTSNPSISSQMDAPALSLLFGQASIFTLQTSDYNPLSGFVNLKETTTNAFLQQSSLILYQRSSQASGQDFAFAIMPTGTDFYAIGSPVNGGLLVGYDAAYDRIVLVTRNDPRAMLWQITVGTATVPCPPVPTPSLPYPSTMPTITYSQPPIYVQSSPYYGPTIAPTISAPCDTPTAVPVISTPCDTQTAVPVISTPCDTPIAPPTAVPNYGYPSYRQPQYQQPQYQQMVPQQAPQAAQQLPAVQTPCDELPTGTPTDYNTALPTSQPSSGPMGYGDNTYGSTAAPVLNAASGVSSSILAFAMMILFT